jgi:hypothetical protein
MRKLSSFFLLMTGVGATIALGEPLSDIPFPAKRADTVKFAKTLVFLQSEPAQAPNEGTFKNPFNPSEVSASSSASSTTVGGAASAPGEIVQLAQIAPNITPSGSVKIGSESFLLFGQKRFKVADHLPIVFEGKSYELEIVEIQSTSFTLRLNGVEITRPIKSAIKPVTKP